MTHTHWDHIQGWPFFVPAYVPGNPFLWSFLNCRAAGPYCEASMWLAPVLAGVPAAIYERLSGEKESDFVSMGIWLLCTLVLTAPAVANMLAAFGG